MLRIDRKKPTGAAVKEPPSRRALKRKKEEAQVQVYGAKKNDVSLVATAKHQNALAPVANLHNVEVPVFQELSKFWRELQIAVKKVGLYDMFNLNWWEDETALVTCDLFGTICTDLLKYFADMNPEVDNLSRGEVFLANFPVGTGYQAIVNYA